MISVHQGKGTPGWLYLTRNPEPGAYWVPRIENANATPVSIVMDERCFEETLIRVERTSTHLYLADVWLWNGVPVFHTKTFQERQTLLENIYSLYTSCPFFETYAVQLRSSDTDVKGKEYYTSEKGARGIYVEETSEQYQITRTDVPDVYKVSAGGYLRVKSIGLSKQLKTFGKVFSLPCKKNEDGTWSPILSSDTVTNGKDT